MPVKISVVIPVFNEEGSIGILFDELEKALSSLNSTYEVIVVDDGSNDQSWQIIKAGSLKYPRIKAIRLGRNFGQTAALSAGISRAQGEIVLTIDGDGQNDPADIPKLIRKLEQGFDLVSGWRKNRKDPYISRQIPSRMANWLIGLITGIKLKDFGCTLKAYRAQLIKGIRLYGEMHRMIPALAFWSGANITELEVNHRPRQSGESKYNISRIFAVFFDLLTIKFFIGYFTRPLHFFGLAGLILMILSLVSFSATLIMKIMEQMNITRNPLLTLGTLLMIIGMQLIALGLLGEISVRIYYESQNKPIYMIKEELGFQ